MASIRREVGIDESAPACWDALADFGAVHDRLARGFVTATELTGPRERRVTFFNGSVVTEQLVAVDEERMRLVYTLTDGLPGCTFYGASAQILSDGDRGSRFVWIVDVLPDDLEPRLAAMMDRGIEAVERTLGAASKPPTAVSSGLDAAARK